MGAANKGIFFKFSESISKLIRCTTQCEHKQHNVNTKNNNNTKLLLRRCVNANANDEISNVRYFSMLRSDHHNNGRRLFSLEKNYYLGIDGPADYLFPSRFGGSCNGILCLEDERQLGYVVLWNPFTDELKPLPPSSFLLSHPQAAANTLFCSSGFGFDPGSQDYKVVRQVHKLHTYDDGSYKPTKTEHYELYSLKTDSWRPIDSPEIHPRYCNPTYVKGSCYWYSRDGGVLSFDFANEVFSTLPSPFVPRGFLYFLLDFDGSLGFIRYMICKDSTRFDLFVWNNESWKKVDMFVLKGVNRPLGFWGRDKCFLEGTNGELLLFDLNTRELKSLGIKDCRGAMGMVSFVESVVSIGELHTVEEMKEEFGSNDITTDEATSNFG